MKTKLQKAIEKKDIEGARALVIELIEKHPDKRSSLDGVTMLVRNFPEVFEEDENDMRDIERKDYSQAIKSRLTDRLKENFSREKLSIFVDMAVSMARHPNEKALPLNEDIVGELIADEFSVPTVGSPEGSEK
ncbi:MAG: hypothetical protein K2J87_04845 [Muribaculaceae bacterium]|nr:hypothetical protein [Muribaculaceae bacterium]